MYADGNILYFDEDSGDVVFNCNETDIPDIFLNNINLDGNFDEDDPGTIIHVRLLAWHIKIEKRKGLQKNISQELIVLKDMSIYYCLKKQVRISLCSYQRF